MQLAALRQIKTDNGDTLDGTKNCFVRAFADRIAWKPDLVLTQLDS